MVNTIHRLAYCFASLSASAAWLLMRLYAVGVTVVEPLRSGNDRTGVSGDSFFHEFAEPQLVENLFYCAVEVSDA